jgi:filamentous hemagglutinin family protein
VFKALSSWFGLLLFTLGYFGIANKPALAQVTSDGTVNTQVNDGGNTAEITGGETRGDNLFHSFQDFSVKTGNEAFFNNADSISNIFSRVTGGNVSDIDGAIRANGSANLFLINPAGIIFGEGASLNIGGSFYGSSASSILFEDGEFSATDLENPPLLTVNAPIGLGFRDNPAPIVNRSVVQDSTGEAVGLEVTPGNNLAFIGGNLSFDRGNLTASGGNIQLGGLSQAGIVSISEDGSFNFPEEVSKSDITLSNGADIDAMGTGGGNVTVNARNLNLTAEDSRSSIRVGIKPESTSVEAQAGDITIDVADKFTLAYSFILNQVALGGVGNSGNITINTGSLEAINGGQVQSITLGQGNTGQVTIDADNVSIDGVNNEFISIDGRPNLNSFGSAVLSNVGPSGVGDAGSIDITTNELSLTNGGQVQSITFGQGNTGQVAIDADNISIDGVNSDNFSSIDGAASINVTSGIFNTSTVSVTGAGVRDLGDLGSVDITTSKLSLTNGGIISNISAGQRIAGGIAINADSVSIDGVGSNGFSSGVLTTVEETGVADAGAIDITTSELSLTNGGQVRGSTFGQGNAGQVTIDADNVSIDGVGNNKLSSGVFSNVEKTGVGDAGGINITTSELSLNNGGQITGSTFGQGNAGQVTIDADNVSIDRVGNNKLSSGVFSTVEKTGVGDAGGISITTSELSLTNGGQITGSTFGQGNAGQVTIDADNVSIDRVGNNKLSSGVFSTVEKTGVGDAGGISITTSELSLTNGGQITGSTFGQGNAGEIAIEGDVVSLDGNSAIVAQAFGDANGGNLKIDANYIIAFPSNGTGNDIVASADAGNGGNIDLTVEQLFGLEIGKVIDDEGNVIENNNNDIDASSRAKGLDGTVNIDTSDINPVQGTTELPSNIVEAKQTADQTCSANREGKTNNGLAIAGRGGVTPAPDTPLNSENISNENPAQASVPQPLETSQGKIQPARGIKVTKSGKIVLTAYLTDNAGERIPDIKTSCN